MQTKRTLTQADVDLLKGVFATKDDIKTLQKSIKSLPTKKDVEDIVAEAIIKVVNPGMDNMAEDIKKELGLKIDSLDRKFDSQQTRQDLHDSRLKSLEKLHPQGKHFASV